MSVSKQNNYLAIVRSIYGEKLAEYIRIKDAVLKPISDTAIGFLGEHRILRLTVEFTTEFENIREEKLQFFVKTLPENDLHRAYVEDAEIYYKEQGAFSTLIPRLQKITSNIGEKWSPICYLAESDGLIFEEMGQKGYRMAPTQCFFDLSHILCAARSLARFHSASIILEDKLSNNGISYTIDTQYKDILKEATYIFDEGHPRKIWMESNYKTILTLIKLLNKYTNIETHEIENKLWTFFIDMSKIFFSLKSSRNVVCHGDLWGNNFMFSYNKDGTPNNSILVDFQFIRYAPCTSDLACFIHLNTNKDFRSKHFDEIIGVYYETLKSQLLAVDINVDSIVPYEQCLKEVDYFRGAATLESCLFSMITWLPRNIVDLMHSQPGGCHQIFVGDKTRFMKEAFETDEIYREIITERLVETVDYLLNSIS